MHITTVNLSNDVFDSDISTNNIRLIGTIIGILCRFYSSTEVCEKPTYKDEVVSWYRRDSARHTSGCGVNEKGVRGMMGARPVSSTMSRRAFVRGAVATGAVIALAGGSLTALADDGGEGAGDDVPEPDEIDTEGAVDGGKLSF